MGKTIYTAGPMELHARNPRGSYEWRDLVKEYFSNTDADFRVVNPTDYYMYGENVHKTEKEIMRFDLRKVEEADIILVDLNGVRKSLGTSDEIAYAYILKKPIIGFVYEELSEDELIKVVHPWKYEQCDRIETGTDALKKAMDYIRDYYG